MELNEFRGAIAAYDNKDFAIRLPHGLMVVCWSRDVALSLEHHTLMLMIIELLADDKQLPDYREKPWSG